MWKSNGEFSASNIFHFLNLFHYIFRMMRKCCPNTPQEISASKLAENDGFCGNLRYGMCFKIYSEAFAHVCAHQLIMTIDIVIIRLFQPSWAHQDGEVQF